MVATEKCEGSTEKSEGSSFRTIFQIQNTKVNAHLHTPYSFSAFKEVNEALDRAVAEGVKVVGINDFYSTAGYEAWAVGCKERDLYPLFNIEFISLNEADQKVGLRVNDPGNPGRTYLSGKGLSHPYLLAEPFATQLADVTKEANAQAEAMCGKVNEILAANNAGFTLDFEWIKNDLTKGSIRECHLAKALRLKVYKACNNNPFDIHILFHKLFGGKELKSKINDIAGVENEIRGNLLKASGGAFVPEDPKAFLPMQTVCDIIVAGGGIPTYPFLADDAIGGYTNFEGDLENLQKSLSPKPVEFKTKAIASVPSPLKNIRSWPLEQSVNAADSHVFFELLTRKLLEVYSLKSVTFLSEEDITEIQKLQKRKYEDDEWTRKK